MVFALNMSQTSALVTLTLESHTIQNSYLVTAAISAGTAGSSLSNATSQNQIAARQLSATIVQSRGGAVSGYFAGYQATGLLTFTSTATGCGCPVIIPAGTAFTDAHGVTIVTAVVASVASQCKVTVRAYALQAGPGGDIPANAIHAAYSSTITASNAVAFAGGQSGESHDQVSQADIDHLAAGLRDQTTRSVTTALHVQVRSNEQLFNAAFCQSKTTSDHSPSAIATELRVTVSTTCTAEAYDYTGAMRIVHQQINTQASTYFSSKFVLVGALQTKVTSVTVVDAKAGTLLLVVDALGRGAYQFKNGLKQSLARMIANQSVQRRPRPVSQSRRRLDGQYQRFGRR